mmetsp:Transcript_11175/g.18783  ORF Transcript_11175/g.18783 Transcript_11175/m.18783 type:complete len:146 (+) Transcript_11175:1116-1553(+)
MIINTALAFSVYEFRANVPAYFFCIQVNYFVVASAFALFPTPAYKTFGTEKAPQIYSIILLSSFSASTTDTILMEYLYPKIGAGMLFRYAGLTSVLALVICYFFDERLDIERLDRRGLILWGPQKPGVESQRGVRERGLAKLQEA